MNDSRFVCFNLKKKIIVFLHLQRKQDAISWKQCIFYHMFDLIAIAVYQIECSA